MSPRAWHAEPYRHILNPHHLNRELTAMSPHLGAVLITGCSTGIGRATAERLAQAGHTVYATARRVETVSDLTGCTPLALDVCDEASMAAAVSVVERDHGAVGVLINNAGYSQSGAVESVPLDLVRSQFETNVFGLVRMCQLVLPAMRGRQAGKIVNISSIGGKLTLPGGGFYHGTKHAVETISDALRFEVAKFGIDVIVIEPGLIVTQFGETAVGGIDEATGDGVYDDFNRAVAKLTADAYKGPMVKLTGGGPDAVAKAIERSITRGRAPIRVPVTLSAHFMLGLRKLLPDRLWDAFVGTQYPRPGSG